MKIGIITFPLGENYGGIMQAYALQKKLTDMGHDVITVNAKPNTSTILTRIIYLILLFRANLLKKSDLYYFIPKDRVLAARRYTGEFIRKYIKTTSEINIHKDYSALRRLGVDAFVVGSDQVWRPQAISWGNYYPYFLGFLKNNKSVKRISYAASFGKDNVTLPYFARQKYSKLLKKFFMVSVREDDGIAICKNQFDVDAEFVLDPTMLIDTSEYNTIINSAFDVISKSNKDFCFEYILDNSNIKKSISMQVARHFDLKIQTILPKKSTSKRSLSAEDCVLPRVEQWLYNIKNAKYIVTDSFHGVAFSILFNTPFVVIGNSVRGISRIKSILKTFCLEDRYIDVNNINEVSKKLTKTIDWNLANDKLRDFRMKSEDFLVRAFK